MLFFVSEDGEEMFKLLKNLKARDYIYLVISIAMIIAQTYLDLTIPDYTAKIIGETNMNVILVNGGIMLGMAIGNLLLAVLVGFVTAVVAEDLGYNIRGKLYGKIQSFSFAEMNKFSTASLMTRTTNDIRQVIMLISIGTKAIIKAPIMAIFALTKVTNVGWQWSTATAVALVLLITMIVTIMCLVIPKFGKIQKMTDDLNRVTRENLTGIRVVRASNAEEFEGKRFDKGNVELTNTNLYVGKVLAFFDPVMSFIMGGLSLAIYWIAAYFVHDIEMMKSVAILSQYTTQIIFAFMVLIFVFMMLLRALVSAKRINEVLDSKNDITPGTYSGEMHGTASVVFENVSFKYPGADDYVLKNISFSAKEGETIAFIGSTGSGKSTIINLIPRMYDATEGRVLVDGVDVREYDIEALNKKIGFIPQKSVLFSGSVRSNVNFGDNDADDATIKEALSIAQASNFVSKMEDGIDSKIAQGGTNISGGQKQRLSIARAIARKPEIFIFDDSFSALDYKTDKKLRSALKKYTTQVTKFIVAQRIGTIKEADKIIVLENGEMVGMGTHDYLLKTCPVYQEIALSQLSKEEL